MPAGSSPDSSPWASGPGELLQHGLSLLKSDSDVDRRLSMICIDNSVELMIKTYLGLPKRVTGLQIGRDRFRDISESFPKMLDALEEHAADKLTGVDLGIIEWYHRLRNELYHQGHGLTVARDKVEVYSELARLLFKNLFGSELPVKKGPARELLGALIEGWARIERAVVDISVCRGLDIGSMRSPILIHSIRTFRDQGLITNRTLEELDALRHLRNEVVHGAADSKSTVTSDVVERVEKLATELERIAKETSPS